MRSEHELKITDLLNSFEKEKEAYKKKIAEIEKSLRDVEGKRGALLLELEKEKAKWNIEKDNLSTKTTELNDKVASLERKNESLLRENEKLKNEKNQLRKQNMKNDSRYTFMFRDQNSSILNNTSLRKGSNIDNSVSTNPTTNRLYSGMSSNYQNQMFKVLGNIDLNGSKTDLDKESVKSENNNKDSKSSMKGKKDSDSTSITSDNKDEK